jgi:hypothetical protein
MVTACTPSVSSLAKRPIYLTAAYLIVAWALMVSYQIFTQTASASVAEALTGPAPMIADLLKSESSKAVVTFICGFAWMFVLSAIVQTLMFGRERRLSIQFLVSLALTVAGSAVLELLKVAKPNIDDPNVLSSPFTAVLGNAVFASFYLALPFIFMLVMDWRYMQKHK